MYSINHGTKSSRLLYTHTYIYICCWAKSPTLPCQPWCSHALWHTHKVVSPLQNCKLIHPSSPPSPKYTGIVVLRDNTSLTSWGKGWHCRSELRGTCRSRSAVPRSRVESLEARRWSTLAQPSSGRRGTCCDRSTRTLPKEQGVGKTRLREKQPKVYYSTVHILGI